MFETWQLAFRVESWLHLDSRFLSLYNSTKEKTMVTTNRFNVHFSNPKKHGAKQNTEKEPYNMINQTFSLRILQRCRGSPLSQVGDMIFTILFAVDVLVRICSFVARKEAMFFILWLEERSGRQYLWGSIRRPWFIQQYFWWSRLVAHYILGIHCESFLGDLPSVVTKQLNQKPSLEMLPPYQ